MKTIYSLALFSVMVLTGCNKPAATPAVDFAAEERAIRAADAQWLAAVKAREVEKALTFWSDDAIMYAPGAEAMNGKQAIRDYITAAFASPDFSVAWVSGPVVMSKSGDMAYITGPVDFTYRAPTGQLVTEKNKSVVVWRKQANGDWKAVVDTWNALPAPGPPSK